MKYKRILASAILALTFPLLAATAQAHPGHTDSAGGHTDSDTGDYHYHHGYEAHAHFDIDGNGTIDCPFDFVDVTDHSSRTSSSGSYTPGDGSEDGYADGYADGYRKGEEEGYERGKEELEAEYAKLLRQKEEEYSKESGELKTESAWTSVLLTASLVGSVYFSLRKRRQLKESFAKSIQEKESSHASRITRLRAEHDAKIKLLEYNYGCHRQRLVSEHSSQIVKLNNAHSEEVRRLRFQITQARRLNILDRIASGEDETIQLPEDIHLRQSFTPIKGSASAYYPYGSYTVFISPLGTKYHCRHNCVSTAKPMHFFDLPADALPCSRCVSVDMRPQPRPEWYDAIRQRLDADPPDT